MGVNGRRRDTSYMYSAADTVAIRTLCHLHGSIRTLSASRSSRIIQ